MQILQEQKSAWGRHIDTDKGRVQRAPTDCFLTQSCNADVKYYSCTFNDLAGKLPRSLTHSALGFHLTPLYLTTMQVVRTVNEIRQTVSTARLAGKRIGFVPTMGNLHEGHLQLVRLAQTTCDVVIVSIFVNPLQFGLNEDWEQYPRTFDADVEKLSSVGTNFLFYPTETEMYPNGMATQTKVEVAVMTNVLCGASRPGHFLGVTTVVTKLFNMVLPDEAVFGIKDYQQLAVIRRMAEDLCIPIKITAAPIARADDGLALSSRNGYLTAQERPIATQIYKSLCWAKKQIEQGRRDYATVEAEAKKQLENSGMRPDYFSVIQQKTLEAATLNDANIAILAAVYLGKTRLIDNVTLTL